MLSLLQELKKQQTALWPHSVKPEDFYTDISDLLLCVQLKMSMISSGASYENQYLLIQALKKDPVNIILYIDGDRESKEFRRKVNEQTDQSGVLKVFEDQRALISENFSELWKKWTRTDFSISRFGSLPPPDKYPRLSAEQIKEVLTCEWYRLLDFVDQTKVKSELDSIKLQTGDKDLMKKLPAFTIQNKVKSFPDEKDLINYVFRDTVKVCEEVPEGKVISPIILLFLHQYTDGEVCSKIAYQGVHNLMEMEAQGPRGSAILDWLKTNPDWPQSTEDVLFDKVMSVTVRFEVSHINMRLVGNLVRSQLILCHQAWRIAFNVTRFDAHEIALKTGWDAVMERLSNDEEFLGIMSVQKRHELRLKKKQEDSNRAVLRSRDYSHRDKSRDRHRMKRERSK